MHKCVRMKIGTGGIKEIIMGLIISLLTTLIMTLLITWLVSGQYLTEENAGYGATLAIILATAAGCTVSTVGAKEGRLVCCTAVSLSYIGFLLIIKYVFFLGTLQGFFETLMLVLGSGVAVALLGAREKTKQKKPRYKIANR